MREFITVFLQMGVIAGMIAMGIAVVTVMFFVTLSVIASTGHL